MEAYFVFYDIATFEATCIVHYIMYISMFKLQLADM